MAHSPENNNLIHEPGQLHLHVTEKRIKAASFLTANLSTTTVSQPPEESMDPEDMNAIWSVLVCLHSLV